MDKFVKTEIDVLMKKVRNKSASDEEIERLNQLISSFNLTENSNNQRILLKDLHVKTLHLKLFRDAMTSFVNVINPTPFGFFDDDTAFQTEADGMITFVKRKLGDDVLSVELTSKEIWACFEEAVCEYSRWVNETKIVSDLTTVLGGSTSEDYTNKYNKQTLDYALRMSEAYSTEAFVGGTENAILGYFNIEVGRQEYDLYTELKHATSGTVIFDTLPSGSKGRMKIVELFHFEPFAAQTFLLNASNMTNFMATNFNYESYVNSSVFYVLPVYEDILRRGMLKTAYHARRSQYSYNLQGSKLRIFPIPSTYPQVEKLFCRVLPPRSPLSGSAFQDDKVNGISGASNFPLGNLPYNTINQPGRQWIRQYVVALAKELIGLIRSKIKSIPIPNGELNLNGEDLLSMGKEEKDKLIEQLKEFLSNLTKQKLAEVDAATAENLNKQLRYIPFPKGSAIIIG